MQLHRTHAADGLVVMSLDVNPEEWNEKEKVLKFLTGQKADFANYIFRDKGEVVDDWLDRHDAGATPAVVLFDRSGKRVPVPEFKTTAEIDAFVKQLLARN